MEIKKYGNPMILEELPDGTLFSFGRTIALKTEYEDNNGAIRAVILGSGEYFWGGAKTPEEQRKLLVQPLAIFGGNYYGNKKYDRLK